MRQIVYMISLQHFMQNHINDIGYYEIKARYEAFLNRDIKIGMFVPVDEKGNVLERPKTRKSYYEFNKAKELVLFEGWTYDFEEEYLVFKIGETAELFLYFDELKGFKLIDIVDEHFPLSRTALKQIYEITNAQT